MCSKTTWEDVNQILLAKKWTYYDSQKGNTYKYNTITWSFNKEYYNDKAEGWFYLYTYEGLPNKISYLVFNKESYSLIQNVIVSAGFKLVKSEIEDGQVTSTYDNNSYTLKVSTEKRQDNDWSDLSTTAYRITLIKKAGIYDPDNGKKTDYYYGDAVKTEYTLRNGRMDGLVKRYHYNGKLKKIGNYSNGIENGLFKEYDEDERIESEYSMSNGELNGSFKTYYPNGKINISGNFLKGKKHGNFIRYDESGTKIEDYNLASDEKDGSFKIYHSNGNLKQSGRFLKGKEHGKFVDYDENGVKTVEYELANGMMNGVVSKYEEGRISYSTTFIDDVKNGQYTEYHYDDENGKLQLKQIGEYLNDEKNGTWKTIFIREDDTEMLLNKHHYTNGIKNGSFQETDASNVIFGLYKNDVLHGEYKNYLDVSSDLFGGILRSTDTTKLVLMTHGYYNEGYESGYWRNYDLTGSLISEGGYSNGLETGEWKYYYSNWKDVDGVSKPYSQQLYLIQNYLNGELEGKSIRYSYLEEEKYLCSETEDKKSPLDTCTRRLYKKILETYFYKSGKLNGPIEVRDSTNEIIAKGFFIDNLKDGEWIHRYEDKDINNTTAFLYERGKYVEDKRNGKWIQYHKEGEIKGTFNYYNGDLHGEYIVWNQPDRPKEKKQFVFGKLTELIAYDSLGLKQIDKYEIYNETSSSFNCRRTEYSENGFASQEYWVKKETEIDHSIFEFIFIFLVSKFSDGTTGYKDGEFKWFNSSNQPIITGKHYKEHRVGQWTFYYYEQNVKIESNFIQGKQTDEKYLKLNGELFSGEFVYIDNENGIKEERKIKDGLRNGKTIYIDTKTNKTIKKESYKSGDLK